MIRLALAVVAGLLLLPDFARAEDLLVTRTDDTEDGVCDGDCSLRDAVGDAETGDRVVLSSATYTLSFGQLTFNGTVAVDGVSARQTTIDGNGNRVAFVASGTATFTDLLVTGGIADQTSAPTPRCRRRASPSTPTQGCVSSA